MAKQSIYEMLREFHEVFDCTTNDTPDLDNVDDDLRQLRIECIREELEELVEAAYGQEAKVEILVKPPTFGVDNRSLVEVADALADLMYFVAGTALCYGIDLEAVLEEVHRSNMAKLQPDGTVARREDGKVLKPEGWTPPDVAGVLGIDNG